MLTGSTSAVVTAPSEATVFDATNIKHAIFQASLGLSEGGVPIGAALVTKDGVVVGVGRNRRVQQGSATRHGETDCLENIGRLPASVYKNCTMYTTLSPCTMCTGAIILYGIPRVVMGENATFVGGEGILKDHGVEVVNLDIQECKDLMSAFIKAKPQEWNEDIGEEFIHEGRLLPNASWLPEPAERWKILTQHNDWELNICRMAERRPPSDKVATIVSVFLTFMSSRAETHAKGQGIEFDRRHYSLTWASLWGYPGTRERPQPVFQLTGPPIVCSRDFLALADGTSAFFLTTIFDRVQYEYTGDTRGVAFEAVLHGGSCVCSFRQTRTGWERITPSILLRGKDPRFRNIIWYTFVRILTQDGSSWMEWRCTGQTYGESIEFFLQIRVTLIDLPGPEVPPGPYPDRPPVPRPYIKPNDDGWIQPTYRPPTEWVKPEDYVPPKPSNDQRLPRRPVEMRSKANNTVSRLEALRQARSFEGYCRTRAGSPPWKPVQTTPFRHDHAVSMEGRPASDNVSTMVSTFLTFVSARASTHAQGKGVEFDRSAYSLRLADLRGYPGTAQRPQPLFTLSGPPFACSRSLPTAPDELSLFHLAVTLDDLKLMGDTRAVAFEAVRHGARWICAFRRTHTNWERITPSVPLRAEDAKFSNTIWYTFMRLIREPFPMMEWRCTGKPGGTLLEFFLQIRVFFLDLPGPEVRPGPYPDTPPQQSATLDDDGWPTGWIKPTPRPPIEWVKPEDYVPPRPSTHRLIEAPSRQVIPLARLLATARHAAQK